MSHAEIKDGWLVVYHDGTEVARFHRDWFPSLMLDMAKALKR